MRSANSFVERRRRFTGLAWVASGAGAVSDSGQEDGSPSGAGVAVFALGFRLIVQSGEIGGGAAPSAQALSRHRRRSRTGRYRTILNSRFQRTVHGQRQICQAYSPSPMEKKMIWAR